MLEDLDQIEARIGVLLQLATQLSSERDALLAEREDSARKLAQLEALCAEKNTALADYADRLKTLDRDAQQASQAVEAENQDLKRQLDNAAQAMTDIQRELADLRLENENYREGLLNVRSKAAHVLDNLPAK